MKVVFICSVLILSLSNCGSDKDPGNTGSNNQSSHNTITNNSNNRSTNTSNNASTSQNTNNRTTNNQTTNNQTTNNTTQARPFIFKVDVQKEFGIRTKNSGYKYNVDCDSNNELEVKDITGDYTCSYTVPGIYTISISGDFPEAHFEEQHSKLISIEQWGDQKWRSMESTFKDCERLVFNATDVPDLTMATSMHAMFENAKNFNSAIGSWNTSKIEKMGTLFSGASSFNQDISSWDVSSVKNMSSMFEDSAHFNQDISSWKVGKVVDMSSMFENATAFDRDIGTWNTSKVQYMDAMFAGAFSFNQDIGKWDVSAVEYMDNMFFFFDTPGAFDQDLSLWKVGKVKSMITMFEQPGGAVLSTKNYDLLLNRWAQQTLQEHVNFGAGGMKYSPGAPQESRDKIKEDFSWRITDGGLK